MTNPTNDTPENQTPATDTPVAPEAAPETRSAEDVAPDEASATESAVGDAEPVVATTAATPVLASDERAAGDTAAAAGDPEPVMATASTTSARSARGRKADDRPKRGPVRPEGPAPLGHFAVIETGGKQYRVSVGDQIAVERLEGDAGSEVTIDRVLMVGGDGAPRIGAPLLDGAAVTATIETQYRGDKIVVFKMKPKKRYRRRTGHRQNLTRLAITGINA